MKHVALALVGACVLAAPVAAQRTTRVDGYVPEGWDLCGPSRPHGAEWHHVRQLFDARQHEPLHGPSRDG